ncbi:OsmC family protein [Arundinibacter roseus]|uniref:OsmC family peroxiredoxin n=1 Tax=Arundinibacter roseus TaxID=2070510 RepID=A0A4R4KMD5_9BACT|nr:OsmC family protein [Arundinibacter roseus]TDB68152.1 OsmC family peroxiredoxin [Arundinibacter roseus]
MSIPSLLAILGQEDYLVSLQARQHEILADEPEELGGKDLGLTPYELVLASLGACTSITMKMYAQRKGWQLDDVDVQLTLTTEKNQTPVIARSIHIKGAITAQQHERLLQIANACPVHQLLANPIQIETTLVK